jgi:hypothetical protein
MLGAPKPGILGETQLPVFRPVSGSPVESAVTVKVLVLSAPGLK